jgi:hypothetical protein
LMRANRKGALRDFSVCGKIRDRAREAGAKARHIFDRLRPD